MNDDHSGLEVEQVRLTRVRADKLELEMKERERKLIPIEEVESLWVSVTLAAKARLLAIPAALAPTLALTADAADIQDTLEKALDDALSELSRGEIF